MCIRDSVGIERLHLEQDAGKSLHDQHPSKSYIDLNRTGVALMEIVSKPDIRSPQEAGAYVKKIRSILRYVGACDGNMEEGSLRADCNVSVRKSGEEFGTRCEIKNLNSVRFIIQAIQSEAERQVEILEEGGKINQETRLFDTSTGETRSMRSKEDAHDYRYFPDPDLLPLEFSDSWVQKIRETLPELPDLLKKRLVTDFGITPYDASILVEEKDYVDFYQKAANGKDGKLTANWMITELFGALKKENMSLNFAISDPEEVKRRDEIRSKAKMRTGVQLKLALEGRLGLILDSTARDYARISNEARLMKNLGYDTYMVFVNTSLEVALQRNSMRDRVLPDAIVIQNHKTVQRNIGGFQNLFGLNNFVIVDNNKRKEDVNPKVHKAIRRMINQKPTSPQAISWLSLIHI